MELRRIERRYPTTYQPLHATVSVRAYLSAPRGEATAGRDVLPYLVETHFRWRRTTDNAHLITNTRHHVRNTSMRTPGNRASKKPRTRGVGAEKERAKARASFSHTTTDRGNLN